MSTLITIMFWLIFISVGAAFIAFYMDAYDRLPADEWDSLVDAVEAGRADW